MRATCFLLVLFIITFGGCKQPKPKPPVAAQGSNDFSAMFYNVENLYDTLNDPATNDDAFTPQSYIPWTAERFGIKLKHIAKVIHEITRPNPPAIVGMAEVENDAVLQSLTNTLSRMGANYNYIHYDGRDERGIDVALLYNPAKFTVIESKPIRVRSKQYGSGRDILYVKGKTSGGAVLHVFVNHWTSRREGSGLSEPKRMAAATILRSEVDNLIKNENNPAILIMGDFNDEPNDIAIIKTLGARMPGQVFENTALYNLLYQAYAKGEGTTYFTDWDLFDQIMVSGNMLNHTSALQTQPSLAAIYKPDWLLVFPKQDNARPNRTMGERYYGGYSDHLPVYVIFKN